MNSVLENDIKPLDDEAYLTEKFCKAIYHKMEEQDEEDDMAAAVEHEEDDILVDSGSAGTVCPPHFAPTVPTKEL